ncbi:hypothetical protein N656DRAFT_783597 [Canariomyces notabilis]|uniref:Uncharacterized protein n=1 Tax=Canariomyces notabilis TaxID=2074819 RepID=A0AAN6T9F4_9PEZI|nr:hypothetical protein N656DRAFT_783597 [Canariomyces arenarius]
MSIPVMFVPSMLVPFSHLLVEYPWAPKIVCGAWNCPIANESEASLLSVRDRCQQGDACDGHSDPQRRVRIQDAELGTIRLPRDHIRQLPRTCRWKFSVDVGMGSQFHEEVTIGTSMLTVDGLIGSHWQHFIHQCNHSMNVSNEPDIWSGLCKLTGPSVGALLPSG